MNEEAIEGPKASSKTLPCSDQLTEMGTYFGGGHIILGLSVFIVPDASFHVSVDCVWVQITANTDLKPHETSCRFVDNYFNVGSQFVLAFEFRPQYLTGLFFHVRGHKTRLDVFLMETKVNLSSWHQTAIRKLCFVICCFVLWSVVLFCDLFCFVICCVLWCVVFYERLFCFVIFCCVLWSVVFRDLLLCFVIWCVVFCDMLLCFVICCCVLWSVVFCDLLLCFVIFCCVLWSFVVFCDRLCFMIGCCVLWSVVVFWGHANI